jgi:RNA pol II accessory factor, Cdc73 family, C-terminal
LAAEGVSVQGTYLLSRLRAAQFLSRSALQGAAEGNLVDTFASISAFYVRFDSDPIPEFVKKWSVNSLVLAKTTRYGDRGVLEKLWSVLDSALAARRSPLNY